MSFLERLLGVGGGNAPQPQAQQMQQAQPMGQAPAMAPTARKGMFGIDFSDPQTAAALQMISNGLTPSVGAPRPMFQGVQQATASAMGMQDARLKREREAKALQDESIKKNRTLGWIEQNAPQYLEAVDLGFLSPNDVYKNLMNPNKTEYQQREELADQYGLPEGSPERLSFVLTNKLPDGGDLPNSVQEFNFARGNGYTGTYDEWVKSKTPQTNINMPGSPEIGTIPQGYEVYIDPETNTRKMRSIPGGPEDTTPNKLAQFEQERQKASVARSAIKNIRDKIDKGGMFNLPEVGVIGSRLSGINQEASDVKNSLATLQSIVSFDRLQAMREASPTGGALGAVSERELALLQSSLGALSQDSSPEQLRQTLDFIDRVMAKFEAYPGAGASAAPNVDALIDKYGG